MDVTRFEELNEWDYKRLNKYLKAYWKLRKKIDKNGCCQQAVWRKGGSSPAETVVRN